jgi:hypothetical protein
MNRKPKCIIITGRPWSGKTTLAGKLGERLWMPVISRDQLKEGYVNTFGVRHDELSPDTDGLVTDFFFRMVNQYLAGEISIVIEAAFQHKVWEPRIPKISELALPVIVLCSVDEILAARCHLQGGLENPNREHYHSDNRVVHYRKTGEFLYHASYEAPKFDLPTIHVSTAEEYAPCLDEILTQIQTSTAK